MLNFFRYKFGKQPSEICAQRAVILTRKSLEFCCKHIRNLDGNRFFTRCAMVCMHVFYCIRELAKINTLNSVIYFRRADTFSDAMFSNALKLYLTKQGVKVNSVHGFSYSIIRGGKL